MKLFPPPKPTEVIRFFTGKGAAPYFGGFGGGVSIMKRKKKKRRHRAPILLLPFFPFLLLIPFEASDPFSLSTSLFLFPSPSVWFYPPVAYPLGKEMLLGAFCFTSPTHFIRQVTH